MEPQDNAQPGSDLPQPQVSPVVQQDLHTSASDSTFAAVANAGVTLAPPTAEDSGLIERTWVSQVQQVVSATKDDPYRQQQEIKRLRAEYIRKRYNKEMNLGE